MSAWDKFQLGWLNYEAVCPGRQKTGDQARTGGGEHEAGAGSVIVVLPDKAVTAISATRSRSSKFYYSGAANNLDDRDDAVGDAARRRGQPHGAGSLQHRDRLRLRVPRGQRHQRFRPACRHSSVVPEGIDGVSGGAGSTLTADLSSYAGQTVTIGFGYFTDGGVQGASATSPAGISIDEIAITGQTTDGAETTVPWNYTTNGSTGFHGTTGSETFQYFNAYVAENRQYLGYDAGLQTGPYNFGGTVGPNWAEHFPYQDGMLVWYWDQSFGDNNVGDHPGGGLILPIDAHPAMLHWANGSVMRPRLQSFDSTFTLAADGRDHAAPRRCRGERAVPAGRLGVRRHEQLLRVVRPG